MSIWYTSVRDFVLQGRNLGKQGKIFFPCGVLQQLKKKKIKEKEEIAEAEKAAEQNERLVQHQVDPCFRIEIDGQQFYLNKKTAEEALYYAAEELKNEVSEAYRREDIDFLAKLQKVLEEGA